MSFLSTDVIKAFLKDNTWLTMDPPEGEELDAGIAESFKQIDSIIFQKTRIPVPDEPITVPGIVRFHACGIFVYLTSGKQGDITQDERLRRNKLYDDAIKYFDDVKNGDDSIIDDNGLVLSTPSTPTASFSSTKRLTDIP